MIAETTTTSPLLITYLTFRFFIITLTKNKRATRKVAR